MLLKLHNIHWSHFSLITASLAIISVLFLQYVMGFEPCYLCYKQRYIWYMIAFISLIACYHRRSFWVFILTLLYLASMGYALYHTGTLYDLWLGPNNCTNNGSFNPSDLQNVDFSSISHLTYNPLCTSTDQKIFGIPIPLGNFLISAGGFLGSLFLFRYSQKNHKGF